MIGKGRRQKAEGRRQKAEGFSAFGGLLFVVRRGSGFRGISDGWRMFGSGIAGSAAARADNVTATAEKEIQSTAAGAHRKPADVAPEASASEKRQATRDITFDTIKFDMQKDEPFVRSMLTPAIEKLGSPKCAFAATFCPAFSKPA